MKNGRPKGEDAESMPVHSDLRLGAGEIPEVDRVGDRRS